MNFVAEILEKHLKERPNHHFIFDEKTLNGLTFKEFYDLSGRVYAYLKNKGIGKEDFVLINLERSVKPFIALMGVWRCGAAFTIVENTYPIDRIKYIYNDCNCKLEINEKVWEDILNIEALQGFEDVEAHNAAYAVYTSGTTGNPKGIIHEYGNLQETNDSFYYQGSPIYAEDENFAYISSLNFVASIILFLPIFSLKKSEFHIVSKSIVKDFEKLLSYSKENDITGILLPPSYVRVIGEEKLLFFKKILVASEPANDITPPDGTFVYNLYGMSESGYLISVFKIDKRYDICPIGQPQFDKQVYLLDENNNEVANGEVGEFCFDNPYVRGYIGLPEENKKAFQNGIFHSNDLAKRLPDGNYIILGRKTDMVKINGNRVEPVEVEAVIKQVLNIDWCGVRGFEEDESVYLVAYYTADISFDINELKEKLSKKLPYYMIPSYFIKIEEIPVNKNGKFDRKSLPVPEIKAEEIVIPETDFEKQMFDIVSKELKIKDFGVTTNLISLGLTSIKAIKLSLAIQNETNYSIKTSDILFKPYIREWFNLVDKEAKKIEISEKQKFYPLTPNQLGIYIDWERNQNGLQYNLPMALKLNNVEPEKLSDALSKVVELHPYLKMRIEYDEMGEIVQKRRDDEQLSILFERLDYEPNNKFFQNRVKPFNLLNNDLVRFEIYYTEKSTYLFFDIHHILFDGTSVNIFLSELLKLYNGEELDKEQVTAYDYSLFLKNWKKTESYNKAEKYFSDLISETESCIYPSIRSNAKSTGKSETYIGKVSKQKIKDYCSKAGITENVFFATVLTQVFHRISREDNIQISTISNGRSLEQLSNTVGMFVQTLPLVSKNTKGKVWDILKSMQEQIISTIKNDKYPYTVLVEKYNVKPNILYAYQGDVVDDEISSEFERILLESDTVKIPLSVDIIPENDNYNIVFEYDNGLYTRDEIEKLFLSVSNFADNLIKQKLEAKIETISLVSEKEANELIKLGTGEKLDYDKTKTFVDLFLEQVKNNPNSVAVVDYQSSMTYAELDKQSDIVAEELIKNGINPDDFVVVKLPRIKEFLVSVIGIWKSGAAYVPIDIDYPIGRINYMIEDSEAKIVIDEEFLSHINFNKDVNPINLTTPDNLAYMIYTSGSTGKPKGVMVSQFNLRSFLAFYVLQMNIKNGDNIAVHASFSFDASIEMYSALVTGTTLHILSADLRCDIKGMYEYFERHHIKGLEMIPSVAAEFMAYGNSSLDYISMGGEVAKPISSSTTHIYNAYGPTEFTDISNVWLMRDVQKNTLIPIGRPVQNSISAVVDKDGNILPRGINGELALIGVQMSCGYWKQPELTNKKFVGCPFIQGQKMYRTGDIVRWNENGELLFIGRIDNQVKLRGFRVELGEIEAVLSKVDNIKSCIVDVKKINDIQHLIAYYVSENELDENKLKSELAETLTEYMIPDIFVRLDKMPLTPNEKINRKVLPVPVLKAQEIILPETEFEKQMFDIVSKELKTKDFGVTTNIISMGLTSVKAIKLSVLIKKETNYSIKTVDILSKPYIREWFNLADKETEKIEILESQKIYPLTPNQLDVYIDWERHRDRILYNTATAFKLGNIDYNKLLDVLKKVIELHPYLKTHIIKDKSGNILQERRDGEQLSISVKKLDIEPDKEFFQQRVKPFNLLNNDLARFEIYYTDKNVYLFMDIFHIIFDGISYNILLSELFNGYEDRELSLEKVSAYDYSLFYNEWLKSDKYIKSEQYFNNLLAGTKSFMYPFINTNNKASGKEVFIKREINKRDINEYCSKLGITGNAFFVTALTQVFHRISKEDSIQITAISSGRSSEQLSNTFGMFIQAVPLVSKNTKDKVGDILKSMQEQIISTIKNDKYPYSELVKKHDVKLNVLYTYQGDVIDKENTFKNMEIIEPVVDALAPISIDIFPEEETYDLFFYYDNGLYTKEEIERLADSVYNFANNIINSSDDIDVQTVPLVAKNGEES